MSDAGPTSHAFAASAGAGTATTGAAAGADASLQRAIGVRALTASIVSNVIGSGIFVLPAAAAAILGPSAIVAYVSCAVLIGLIALCFAECGSRVAISGGIYAYVETAFGPYPGAVAGALMTFSTVAASAASAVLMVDSAGALWPALASPGARAAVLVLLYGGLVAFNLRGVAAGTRLVEVVTFAKVAPLVLLAIVGCFYVQPANFAGFEVPTGGALGAATLLLVYAFLGVEIGLQPSGEVQNPARTVPRSIALALLVIASLYGALQFVAQGVLGARLATEQTAPLAAVAREIAGAPGGTFVLLAAAISTFGYVASDVLCSPRSLFGLARDGVLPRALAYVNPRTRAPQAAILAYAGVALALALTSGFTALILMSTVAILFLYAGCALATLALRRRDVRLEQPPFVAPGGRVVPLLAFAVTLWLLAQATWQEFAACGAVVVAVSLLYAARRGSVRAPGSGSGSGSV